jgi:hypothetical protein
MAIPLRRTKLNVDCIAESHQLHDGPQVLMSASRELRSPIVICENVGQSLIMALGLINCVEMRTENSAVLYAQDSSGNNKVTCAERSGNSRHGAQRAPVRPCLSARVRNFLGYLNNISCSLPV